MRVALQVQYAIFGVFDLAYNGHGVPVQVRVIGERQAIPARYLEQIFQRLRRAKLVHSKRGPGGGYVLARPASEITLRHIVEAIEGPIQRMAEPPSAGPAEAFQPRFVWSLIADRFGEVLDEINVEDLCGQAARAAVRRADADAQTYVI